MSGKARNKGVLESIMVEEIRFEFKSQPGVMYQQIFRPFMTYDAIGTKNLGRREPGSTTPPEQVGDITLWREREGSGCNAGGIRLTSFVWLFIYFIYFVYFVYVALLARRGEKSRKKL